MVTKEEFSLVEKRFEAWNEKFILCCISPELGNYTKDEILGHMKAKDEIGEKLAEIQMYYLKKLKERR